MALKNTPQEWGSMSKFLHWSVVVLIVGQGILGLTMGDLPRDGAIHPVRLHKSIGVLILTLAVLRLVWTYAISRRPEELPMPNWQKLAARLGHLLLYGLMIALPLTGWLLSDYGGRGVQFFGIDLPRLVAENEAAHELFEGRHETLFWVLVGVAVGHVLAALYHHVFQRDRTLLRMLPGRR